VGVTRCFELPGQQEGHIFAVNLESVQQLGPIGAEVTRGLERALQRHPTDSYRLSVREDHAVPGGLTIELVPANSVYNCAEVRIHVNPTADVWVTIGEGLELELPDERSEWLPLGLEKLQDDIEGICSAAMRGEVEETVIFDEAGAIESAGTITIDGRAIEVRIHYGGSGRQGKRRERHHEYQPYVPFGE
jgi:hypothetical protein